ncbi:arginase family protein, partial [Bacillus sp. HC-TM]
MKKEISVIGVPMDLGQMRRGVDMGPSAIRYAGVIERIEEIGYDVKDMGDSLADDRNLMNALKVVHVKSLAVD